MKTTNHRQWQWFTLLIIMLVALLPSRVSADEMKNDSRYHVYQKSDHLNFEILVTDLKYKNTWAKAGKVVAYSQKDRKGTKYEILTVYTEDWDDDDKEWWDVYAGIEKAGAVAFIETQSQSNGQKMNNGVQRYTISKGKSNLYTVAKIQYYCPTVMAGKSWYFYYEMKHSNDDTYNHYIGQAFCHYPSDNFTSGKYRISRDNPRLIKFTVPDVDQSSIDKKIEDERKNVSTYTLNFTYTLQNGTKRTQKETTKEKQMKGDTYSFEIPTECANFKRVDLTVSVKQQLIDNDGKEFKSETKNYTENNLFPSVPIPGGINADFDQIARTMSLKWDTNKDATGGEYKYYDDIVPFVYYIETDKGGTPLSGQSWSLRKKYTDVQKDVQLGFTDKGKLDYNTYYIYKVVNVPKAWLDNKSVTQDNMLNDDIISWLASAEIAKPISTEPHMEFYNLHQDIEGDENRERVRLTWEYSRVPLSSNASNVDFQVWKREKDKNLDWAKYRTVTAPANPKAGSVVIFDDYELPNNRVSYEYKVSLSINNDRNYFESDPVTAGLLNGSTVSEIDATKGTNSTSILVSWKAHQVGTGSTSFELFRRYAGTDDEFLKVHSVSGTSDSYTYEDNTVQPGYFYEYKIECYSGDKSTYTDNTYQNALSAVGFCQVRGVISGRVSFGTGTAVDGVRVNLRPSDNADGGYSQRVNGPSEGIAWDADAEETAKLLGTSKNYTVQMFISPDGGLGNATFGTLPGVGMLGLQQQTDSTYRIVTKQPTDIYYRQTALRAVYRFTLADKQTLTTDNGIRVYTEAEYNDIKAKWEAEGYVWMTSRSGYDYINVADTQVEIFRKLEYKTVSSADMFQCQDYDVFLPKETFSLLTITHRDGAISMAVNNGEEKTSTGTSTEANGDDDGFEPVTMEGNLAADFSLRDPRWSAYIMSAQKKYIPSSSAPLPTQFAVGGAPGVTEVCAFKGNLSELRIWDHMLNDKEKSENNDRVLSGRENGLKLYWPMDEGINRLVFDASYANDMPNGHHGTVGNNITASSTFPSRVQLDRYGMTNDNGEYTIRGIPFNGSGTSYTVTPSKSIHEFSPQSRSGFISSGSLTLNSYDFTDESSFPVRGKITYLNTNIPVDSIQLKIDGNVVQGANKQASVTDAEGMYEISVPIGPHLIEAYKDGHRLTSFPMDGSNYNFTQAETVNFIDSTLVNVTGRINGGSTDAEAPVGFRKSVNRIGQARVKLSLGKEANCSFNYIVDEHGNGSFGTENLPVESATKNINSTAYRAGGSHDDTYYIYIDTDPETGEFSAMLPPLRYKVESIRFTGGDAYNNESVFSENLPMLDATNTNPQEMPADSIENESGVIEKYSYAAKMVRQYRSQPVIDVYQKGMENGAFGEKAIEVPMDDGKKEAVKVVDFVADKPQYVYGTPLFLQNETYDFEIYVSEKYRNQDTGKEYQEHPGDAVVEIANEASYTTTIYAKEGMIEGKKVKPGVPADVQNVSVKPDSTGLVFYEWVAGWPNLADGYLRNLTISVSADNRRYNWKAPNSRSDALDFVVLGGVVTGTNFVTAGPDNVDMILRRPPGNTSFAQLTTDSIYSSSMTTVRDSLFSGGGGLYVSILPTFKSGFDVGPFAFKEVTYALVANHQVVRKNTYSDTQTKSESKTYSVSETMKTSTHIKNIQNKGDTYIGRSTNMQFGKARRVHLYKQADGSYILSDKDGISVGEQFATTFVYPQRHIEETLIPNWRMMAANMLDTITGPLTDTTNVAKRVKGKVKYYTNLRPGQKGWCTLNSDESVWTKADIENAGGFPSYRMINDTDDPTDSLQWCLHQIEKWQFIIAQNEKEKLAVFESDEYLDNNYSIASGTSVSQSKKIQYVKNVRNSHKRSYQVTNDTKFGLLVNNIGAYGILNFVDGWGDGTTSGSDQTESRTVSWTMSDSEPFTAISCDVYNSPNGWGPIFRTRGGQTYNPYEDATYTKYYQPGTKMDEATMRVELPQIRVDGSNSVTGVPVGGKAEFKLLLTNMSETGSTCTYVLEMRDKSNPDGAHLTIDGLPMSYDGRRLRFNGNETIAKTLFVAQGSRSVTTYNDIALVLRSEKDVTTGDTVTLSVQFVPASASIEIKVDHDVLNKRDMDEFKGYHVTLFNLDRQDKGLVGVRLQTRRKGSDAWTLAKEWKVEPGQNEEKLPDGTTFDYVLEEFPDDGIYELRAQTYGKYGNDDVTFESGIIEVTQDLRGPKVLGSPYPENGKLDYTMRNNLHLRFNETLNKNALSISDCFRIEGDLNNAAFDSQLPDVALQLNGDEMGTQATYNLKGNDVAIEGWFYRQSDGIIMGIGTDNNSITLSTHDGGLMRLRMGDRDNIVETGVTLPANVWNYIAVSFRLGAGLDGENLLDAVFVNASMTSPQHIVKKLVVPDIHLQGRLFIGGDDMKGMMSEVAMWNIAKSVEELYLNRQQVKAAYTPGLVGYWRMDEGHGTKIADRARSREINMKSESWYINNRNLALKLDGTHPLLVDISNNNARNTDSYAIEFWFRADNTTDNKNASIAKLGNNIAIDFIEGRMAISTTSGSDDSSSEQLPNFVLLADSDYVDNNWHHFALNVRRGTNAIAYIDGRAVKTMPESTIPAPRGQYMAFGGYLNSQLTTLASKGFTGDIDDLRLWGAALTGKLIEQRRYERLDKTYAGLSGYFPMESIDRLQSGTVDTKFSLGNYGNYDTGNSMTAFVATVPEASASDDNAASPSAISPTQSVNAPALLPGSQRLRLTDSDFSFTASDNEIYFNLKGDNILPKMDGNDFTVSVENIKDSYGNTSEPVAWGFHADFACLNWNNSEAVFVQKFYKQGTGFQLTIKNIAGGSQPYEILGMPSWITTEEAIGTIEESEKDILFFVDETVPVGHYTEYIYVSDRNGIKRPKRVDVNVAGDEPIWFFDETDFENNMTITGQVYVGGRICEYVDTQIAAFDQLGRLCGVASPRYVSTRDAYYVDMMVYGDASTLDTPITFKLYDSSSGRIYPVVEMTMPEDGSKVTSLLFNPDSNYGNFDYPVRMSATSQVQQQMDIYPGWNWRSMFVQPQSTAINDVFPNTSEVRGAITAVKSRTQVALVSHDDSNPLKNVFQGTLTNIVPGEMYKIQTTANLHFDLIGEPIDLLTTKQTIGSGYNWIGSLSGEVLPLGSIFADLDPVRNDLVKGQSKYATYSGNGVWEGQLSAIVPGEGYVYHSNATVDKSFSYPAESYSRTGASRAYGSYETYESYRSYESYGANGTAHFVPVDNRQFPDNMTIVAVVENGGKRIDNAEVAAFMDGQCRGAIECIGGYHFLTVMGTSETDAQKPVEIRVYANGKEYVVDRSKVFITDAIIGNLDEPLVLDLANADGIADAVVASPDDEEWYTLQGIKIGRKPTRAGTYIYRGEKIVVW